MINTRFTGSGQLPGDDARRSPPASRRELRATFPCNRIVALERMSLDPTQAGYAFTGIDDPNVYALLSDFEQRDWNDGRSTDPARPPWNNNFTTAFPRIKGWDFGLASTAAANPLGRRQAHRPRPAGHRRLELRPDRAGPQQEEPAPRRQRKLGPQSVQTQDACADGGGAGFGARAKPLRLQYNFKFITKKVKVKGKMQEGEEDVPPAAQEEGAGPT